MQSNTRKSWVIQVGKSDRLRTAIYASEIKCGIWKRFDIGLQYRPTQIHAIILNIFIGWWWQSIKGFVVSGLPAYTALHRHLVSCRGDCKPIHSAYVRRCAICGPYWTAINHIDLTPCCANVTVSTTQARKETLQFDINMRNKDTK